MEGVAGGKLTGSCVSAMVLPGEGALDEGWWATIWHGDGLPDMASVDSLDVGLLEVLDEDVFGVKK